MSSDEDKNENKIEGKIKDKFGVNFVIQLSVIDIDVVDAIDIVGFLLQNHKFDNTWVKLYQQSAYSYCFGLRLNELWLINMTETSIIR